MYDSIISYFSLSLSLSFPSLYAHMCIYIYTLHAYGQQYRVSCNCGLGGQRLGRFGFGVSCSCIEVLVAMAETSTVHDSKSLKRVMYPNSASGLPSESGPTFAPKPQCHCYRFTCHSSVNFDSSHMRLHYLHYLLFYGNTSCCMIFLCMRQRTWTSTSLPPFGSRPEARVRESRYGGDCILWKF